MRTQHHIVEIATGPGIQLHDITPQVRELVRDSEIRNGIVAVTSRHTTTALVLNENESRLLDDVCTFLTRLVPPGDRYLHNDIAQRDCPQDEPENAHSHLAAMLLGSSETVALMDGKLDLGTWQSIMLVELDGPRARTVSVQILGS